MSNPLEYAKEMIERLTLELCLSSDGIDAKDFPLKGEDDDEVEFFLDELEDMMVQIEEAVDAWTNKKIANSDFLKLEFLVEDTVRAATDIRFVSEGYQEKYENLLASIQMGFDWIREQPYQNARKDFYIYFHKDSEGNIFYVGKGTGRRAWAAERHQVWREYVNEKLKGKYSVEIHKDSLMENEALEEEAALISKYGEHLVNWINPGRKINYEALKEFHRQRDANRAFVAETKSIEKTNIEEAITRYRSALESMRQYEKITYEKGVIADLGGGPNWGDLNILDRLTLCLKKTGKLDEARREAESYFSEFPTAVSLTVGKAIHKRVGL